MATTKVINKLEKGIMQQRRDEQEILNEIAAVTTLEFAQQAADVLEPKKTLLRF